MTTPNRPPNVTSKFEEERLRAAEQSQMVYLQGQIDELRRLFKEQTNKYNWAMEQVRKTEGSVAQVEGLFDRYRQEINLTLDTYRRDIANLRKEVAGALVKIEEGTRPIRDMQAQIQQLGDARRQDREATANWLSRIEQLEERIGNWQSQFKEIDERQRLLAGRLDGLATADEQARNEIRKVFEDLQIEKQSLRRQAVEAQQLIADVQPTLESLMSRVARVEEIRKEIDVFVEKLPLQISALDTRATQADADLKRVERVSTERFLMNQERLEEVRRQQDAKMMEMTDAGDHRLRQVNGWLERLDSWIRELEQRHAALVTQLNELDHGHTSQLTDLERRDVRLITMLTATLREHLSAIQAEQVERGIVAAEE
ncbi:MAG TPA: hypothetical protein PKC19_03415 [Roseiflexaceae bacterium]|nr:hypothetical protein [Roseiflexaceae bacterium]